MPLPFYKSPTLLLGWGLSPFVFWRLWKIRPDVIHAAFPGLPPPLLINAVVPFDAKYLGSLGTHSVLPISFVPTEWASRK